MDGVLVDSMPLHFRAWEAFVAKYRIDISPADLRHLVDARRNVEIMPLLLGRDLGADESAALIDEKESQYHRLAATELKEIRGARAFLNKARSKGYPLVLATAAS